MPADDSQDPKDTKLLERLEGEMKAAMRAGDRRRLGVLRMLLAEGRNADLQNPPATPQRMVEQHYKRLRKSREEYEKLDKPETVAELDEELAIIEEFVPRQASAQETAALVDAFLAEHSELGPADAGRATGLFMKQHAGAADPKAANDRIRQLLAGRQV